MVDTLNDIGPGTIVIAGDTHFKVYKVDSKARMSTMVKYKDQYGTHFSENSRWIQSYEIQGQFEVVRMDVKSVPTTWNGAAKSSDCKYNTITLFVDGDQEAYQDWLKAESKWRGVVDVKCAMVSVDPDAPKPIGNLKGFNKMDMICAVIMAHGPSTRDDILRRVATMEGKPWVVSSNHEYFGGNRQGAIEDYAKGPRNKKLYCCTVDGLRRGAAVIDRFGMETILAIP